MEILETKAQCTCGGRFYRGRSIGIGLTCLLLHVLPCRPIVPEVAWMFRSRSRFYCAGCPFVSVLYGWHSPLGCSLPCIPRCFSPVPCLSSSMGLSLVRPWCWLENKQQQQTGTPVLPRHYTLVFTSFLPTEVFPGVFQDGPAPLDGTHPPSHPRTWQGHWVAWRTCVDEDPRRSVRRIPSQPANPRSNQPRRGPPAAPEGTRKAVRSVDPDDPARGLVRSPRKERYLAVSTVRSLPGSCLLPRGRSRSSSETSR